MIFEFNLSVPANTLANAPASLELPMARGIIHKLEADFPAGCNNLVLVTIRRAIHQVWPANPDGQLKGNFHTISFPVWYPLEESPYQLEAYGWSPGTSYSHTITLRFGITPREILMPPSQELGILHRIDRLLFGRRL